MVNKVELLNRITTKIRQSLELQTVLNTAVIEVRAFLKSDRVKIYKFDEDGNGQVIAESLNEDRLPSLKGLYFPAGDIPPQARELFLKAKVRTIVNLDKQEISLSQPDRLPSTATGELTVAEVSQESLPNLLQRPVDPCHVEYLTLMGVKSSMVVPLVAENRLWGLLISHHRRTKDISRSNLQIIQIVAEQLEMAISQANYFQTLQRQAQRETLINEISHLLHSPVENEKILPKVLAKIVPALEGTGGLLCMRDNTETQLSCYSYGSAPNLVPSEWSHLQTLATTKNNVWAINHLEAEQSIQKLLPTLKRNQLGSLLLMPLSYKTENLGNLAIFRQEINTEKLWAGSSQTDPRQSRPRQSFWEWKEIKQGQADPWKTHELELIQSLGNNLSMAVMQDRLFRQERKQRILVEMRNQELDHARSEAEKASRLKSTFISTSSHELRTPLASILNYLKLLKEGFYDSEEELAEYIELANNSAENLHDIIDDVLDISKIEAGKMAVDLEIIELESLLSEQLNLFKSDSLTKNIELLVDCQVEKVYGDRHKLKQVITNLLNNAFKFTQQGEIRLKAIPKTETTSLGEKTRVEISVVDTGIGIEPEKQVNIFDAFIQEDSSIRRHYGGSGLGLTICKQLMELMGGTITLSSQGRNLGTKVTISLRGVEKS